MPLDQESVFISFSRNSEKSRGDVFDTFKGFAGLLADIFLINMRKINSSNHLADPKMVGRSDSLNPVEQPCFIGKARGWSFWRVGLRCEAKVAKGQSTLEIDSLVSDSRKNS